MITKTMSSISRQFVRVSVSAHGPDAPVIDTLPALFAFMGSFDDEPEDTDWIIGSWESGQPNPVAHILVGKDSAIPLADGWYWVWCKIVGTIEVIAERVGQLVVT